MSSGGSSFAPAQPSGPPDVRQLRGVAVIERALREGRALGLLLVEEGVEEEATRRVVELARERGVPVRTASAAVLRRMTSIGPPASLLALEGRDPSAGLDAVLSTGSAVWLLVGLAYPTNAGVAIRTAEGSGAGAIVIDAEWDHTARRAALRASMRADWYMPVFWQAAEDALSRARAAGYRLYAIENVGEVEPWDVDLRPPALFMIGGEAHGIPEEVLARCDGVLRVPMAGFIPSYNLQIAVGVVAAEVLRQRRARPADGRTPG